MEMDHLTFHRDDVSLLNMSCTQSLTFRVTDLEVGKYQIHVNEPTLSILNEDLRLKTPTG